MCDFCFCFVLFCFASLLLFLGVFLPVIHRRGVRYSRCPSLWLSTSSLVGFDCYTPFPPPSFSLRCPCPCFVFLSGLSCTIYICIWLPFLPYAYYMWSPWFVFVFVPWFFSPSESLPGKDVLCRLLPPPLPSVCFLFFSFLFRPCSPPICFGVTSSIL